jgi:hypothetical protein
MLQIETHPQSERERVGCSFFFPDISIPIEREREKNQEGLWGRLSVKIK